jgi:para-aminobenzoate synthetase/4-amino-4-deoxychorismate lyase
MGVGAGIVYDSVAADELAECRLKADFLTSLNQPFELFETMLASRENGVRYVQRHLQRLQSSADFFGFRFDFNATHIQLQQHCDQLAMGLPYRLRLSLQHGGDVQISSALLTPLDDTVRVKISPHPMRSDDLFLRHKSSVREVYDAAWRSAEQQGAFDMLFFNEAGALTEGGRSNVFVKLDGMWFTPPLEAGVLPGVMRSVLLDDPTWNASERHLTLDDLRRAQEVIVCNALRGVIPVALDWTSSAPFIA